MSGCCYCQGAHSPQAYNVVRSVCDRKKILKTAGRCYVCLRVGHLSRNCRSKNKCRQCNGRHHLSICEGSSRQDNKTTSADPSLQSQSQSSSSLNPAATPFAGNTTTSCCVSTKNSVLLQTARATVFNTSHHERQWSMSIQFDSGSQRPYVTEGDFLNLKSMRHKSMTIMTFGSNKPEQAT